MRFKIESNLILGYLEERDKAILSKLTELEERKKEKKSPKKLR